MWQALLHATGRLVKEASRVFRRDRSTEVAAPKNPAPQPIAPIQPLKRLLLTDGVSHTLFEEFAAHRQSTRGEEETGWVLLGIRDGDAAIVVATLPAGANREAGVAHVRFNADAQAIGSRIVRQQDRSLTIVGVVHTHPGSLRHPSDADFRGDSEWVAQLRGKEGVFGIGTSDANPGPGRALSYSPRPHVQCLGKLCLSWYGLRAGAGQYHPLAVELVLGPDLARPLHPLWETLEIHAQRLERLARQQAGVAFEVTAERSALVVRVPLAEPESAIEVLVEGKQVGYFLRRGNEVTAVTAPKERLDQGVYLLLAQLASQ